ncbi:histidine kinase [Vibrio sp. SM6]|uniref:Histidine kinase n=1 Tax=Vibrio agarilyticus TaxID=2726741 RepID=A0A7X8TT73_9VIBR|nr:cache domain-containing protein [Vibrio agarilyticus]NLS14376.1 histidine kinase [Vibrio agarilyticus]
MPLKVKLILLALVPLLLVSGGISWISIYQARLLGEREIAIFEKSLIASHERALKDSVDLAMSAIAPIYTEKSLPKSEAQQAVRNILTNMRFGDDGYFFVYDRYGVNIVHPVQPQLVGENLLNLQDKQGKYLIQSLLQQAQAGGGYEQYLWQKPSTGETVLKLSYVRWLDDWQWMIGTGLYFEDVSQEVAAMHAVIQRNIETTFFSVVVILSVMVAVIVVITLAINMHEHRLADRNLKELSYRTVMFQEDEKKHLARELHDGVNQLLVSSRCHLELLSDKLTDPVMKTHLQKSQYSLITAINEVRHLSHQLRPSALDDIGLEAALATLLSDFRSHSGIEVESYLEMQGYRLKSEVTTTLYRVTQEALNNIEKHAKARCVVVNLQRLQNIFQLMIRDDGIGFDPHNRAMKQGIGLRNMQERVEFIGGEFELVSEPGLGTEITVMLELKEQHYG